MVAGVKNDAPEGATSASHSHSIYPLIAPGLAHPTRFPAGPRNNVWSSTFDPGRNANLKNAGRSYYDTPSDGKSVMGSRLHI